MELSTQKFPLDLFGTYPYQMRHPRMELGDPTRHLQPAVSTPSSPSYNSLIEEHSKRVNRGSKSSDDGSWLTTDAKWGCKSYPKPYSPSTDAGERPNAKQRLPSALAKRTRALHDVDGPGTAKLPVKKRRLLLRLVTSRLSRPFSLPATHILIRESGDTMPVLHRIQQCVGARRAGHQSALVRKAAILNRVRIGVRTAAVSRGHVVMADLTRRGNALNHGLLLVTTPAAGVVGAMFPVGGEGASAGGIRGPHTTSFHPHVAQGQQPQQQWSRSNDMDALNSAGTGADAQLEGRICAYNPPPAHTGGLKEAPLEQHVPCTPLVGDTSDEEDTTAFPATSFRDRYADLSDDDMDDVYADFSVLFGSGVRSPEARAVGGSTEEQFYEEYLDELDGIPWVV